MMKERHSLRTVADAIARRADFDCNGTLSGRSGYAALHVGQLPSDHQADYDGARYASDFYVVHSYVTPIAWFANGRWTVPAVKYSPTTSRHQSRVRLAIN